MLNWPKPEPDSLPDFIDRAATELAAHEAVRMDHSAWLFMVDNDITDPRDVTMIYQANPGSFPAFSHFEYTPFNDQGAGT